MLEESLTVDSNESSYQVTAVISHIVRPGREQGYEEWFHGIAAAARKFKGHLGVSTIRPNDQAHPEYVVMLKFDRYDNLKTWLESDIRRQWLERLQPLIEQPETVQTLTGLETWFALPKRLRQPPPRYKMAIVTWVGVQIVTSLTSYFLESSFASLPRFINLAVSNVIVVIALTYFVMPQLTRLFNQWLYPKLDQ
ncbi:MAG TPA: antibiotic biosynthesis monooxygenase [Leptolyngbyaceae cyanobacterium M33_DOE_097]|uniref:Antibiotic biosynthesis monooxygenase n=1 Tax=Oscillatoriales cyanobacterium SpSt-418 TaxID=2282169 RepID=A0A7C3KFD3_9CYAN|nr:antibiotic biosynthesis monooxygenase [Leptolyngbyaceae cyanobacterium M33_DOE_097]